MQITDDAFETEVLRDPGVVLVDFWASWCPPCKMMEPVVERLRAEFAGRAKVVGLNIDRNPRMAQAYKVASVPTFAVHAAGRLIEQRTGALTENQLRGMLDAALEQAGSTQREQVVHREAFSPPIDRESWNGSEKTSRSPIDSGLRTPDPLIIVSGLPRSGTSMMMRMLEAGGLTALTDRLRTPDEDNPNGYYEFESVKKTAEDSSWLQGAGGKVVKMVYTLLRDLPADRSYRVIFMRRKIEEILASQRAMLQRQGKSVDVPDAQMAQLFERDVAAFDQWIREQPNFEMLDVNFNRLIADCRTEIDAIDAFLGGGLDKSTMAEIVDPSLYRQRAG